MNTELNCNDTFNYTAYPSLLKQIFEENGLSAYISDEILEKLTGFCEYLLEQNKLFNLTAIKTPEAAALLHFADSLTLAKYLPQGANVLDIGSGAGFPAVPLAIARPDLSVTALDSTQKRINFINSAAKRLDLTNLNTICARAEDVTGGMLEESFDYVTARAVAPYPILFELAIPAVKIGGFFVAMKSRDVSRETKGIENISNKFSISHPVFNDISLKGDETFDRTIVFIKKHGKTPQKYPRPYAQIKKKPLF